ncbi:cupin domain-containing protein [Lutimonas sp.]|uniref:cupin domain-containing protein n=1 Tax=Lutimonas sp. TaxID=1872403 RepID=UPI003D9B10D3
MAHWILGHKIDAQSVTGDYDMITGDTPAHTPGPPPHQHHKFHEVFLVTEGEMEFLVNGSPVLVQKGESINLPPDTIHTFSNNSDQSCKWVNVHSPKGFLKFFEDFGVSDTEENAATQSTNPAIIEKVLQTAADYDMVISM